MRYGTDKMHKIVDLQHITVANPNFYSNDNKVKIQTMKIMLYHQNQSFIANL